MKLHTHNSIPNYFDNADEGCPICIRNLAISDTLKQVDEIYNSLKKDLSKRSL